ncbi:hypothetical protein BaRGS_00009226 [Batillaria attramentaria]|uniref:Uncharacterized protein n=1 Tax=Batillaria attramentaria TaxID=370345 RepID=A0ABD0LJ78_9CAEN
MDDGQWIYGPNPFFSVSELSKAPAEISQCVAEKEWEEFHDKLEDFPHSFQLENQEQLIPDTLKRLKKGIESALSVGLKTSLETARARNLLAYLLFCLGHPADSLAQTDEALSVDGQQQNIVSLANRAVILWQTGRRDDAGKQVELLQDLKSDKGFSYLHVKARAELAFCYTRMGPRFFSKAIAVFKDVLEQAKEPEKWLWTFGLALTKRRCLRLQLAPYMQEHDRRGEFFATLKSFQTVLENTQCTNLKAKTFAELAMLPSMTTDTQIKADLMAAMHGMSPKDCCEQALQLDGNDVSVLTKCGMIFGKEKNFTRAIGILTKAVSLRKSSRSYHHIGLAYKALAKSAEQDGGPPPPSCSADFASAGHLLNRETTSDNTRQHNPCV